MASWSPREGRLRGGRPPPWVSCCRDWAVEYVPLRLPPQRRLDQLLSDMQSHLEEMEKVRAALLDAYPLFWAGRGSPAAAAPHPHARPEKPERPAGASESRGEEEEEAEGGRYRFSLDVAGFAPEELSVQLRGRRLTVRAKHDRRSEAADGCVSHEYREVRKEVVLPDDADLEGLACALDGGRLCVEAPRLALPEPRAIPVALGGPPASLAAQRGAPPPPQPAAGPQEEEDEAAAAAEP